jgi:hypothetical protein
MSHLTKKILVLETFSSPRSVVKIRTIVRTEVPKCHQYSGANEEKFLQVPANSQAAVRAQPWLSRDDDWNALCRPSGAASDLAGHPTQSGATKSYSDISHRESDTSFLRPWSGKRGLFRLSPLCIYLVLRFLPPKSIRLAAGNNPRITPAHGATATATATNAAL